VELVSITELSEARLLHLGGRAVDAISDPTNRLTRARVLALTAALEKMLPAPKPLIIIGNDRFFSAGADLNEIAALSGAAAYDFAQMGQRLMTLVDDFPAPVIAAIRGHCMGGGLDLALACDLRIAAPDAGFGHRGAALGIMTGWGGTQRLPRLIGYARALQMLVAADHVSAARAFEIGLVQQISEDPVASALEHSARFSERIAAALRAPVS